MSPWPPEPGSYVIGDPQAPVAVCTLTTEELMAPLAHLTGVAIVGKVYTANLGIERIVRNLVANPAIRFLLLCGKDSPLFRPGQSLAALFANGIDQDHMIIGATGYQPVVATLSDPIISRVRRQIELVDWTGEVDQSTLEVGIQGLASRNPGPLPMSDDLDSAFGRPTFTTILPGGQREPLQYDPKGYFVITVDQPEQQILLRHYTPTHVPAHEMRGRSAGPMLLGLLREGLVTQLSHAGYLGEELAKAQAALQFGLHYTQDRPLRAAESAAISEPTSPPPAPVPPIRPSMPPIQPALTWNAIEATPAGATIDVVLLVHQAPIPNRLTGFVLEGVENDPFSTFHQTTHELSMQWTDSTTIVMGDQSDLQVKAILRVLGTIDPERVLIARRIAVLTEVAQIQEA